MCSAQRLSTRRRAGSRPSFCCRSALASGACAAAAAGRARMLHRARARSCAGQTDHTACAPLHGMTDRTSLVARAVFLPQCLYLYSVVIPLSSTASPQTRTSGCCWSQQRTGTYRGITSTEGVAQYSVDHRAIREARGYSALYYRIHSIQYYSNKWPQ
jgi:hypothetical protein